MCLKSASVVLALSLALACAQRQISFPNGAPERRPAAPVRGSAGGGVSVACTDLNGRTGQCVAAISCAEHAEVLSRSSRPKSCDLGSGNLGVCCPAPASDTPNKPGSVLLTVEKRVNLPQIEDRQQFARPDLTNANNVGQGYLDNLLEIQRRLKDSGDYIKVGTPAAGHQSFFRVSPNSLELAYKALAGIETTRDLAKKFGLGPEEAAFGLQDYTAAPQFCPPPSKCPPKTLLYRTADGSCNNIQEPEWGKSNTGMQRILPPSFTDGIWEPRKYSVSGNPLPSGRLISAATIPDFDNPHRYFTALVTQFGQFLDHDITHLGVFKIDAEENVGIMCCRDGLPIIPPPHPACMPIEIPPDDVFYSRFGQRCMEFVRALPAPRPGCTLGYAQPINVNTHLLDSSQVYGSTEEDARELREFKNGRMAVLYTRPRESLPLALREGDECTNITTGVRCFRGGDDRVNEQPGLTLVHLTTLREHNRVAGELQALNPHWDDERLYQEARRILNAELTHITYNEWLPIILGPTYMKNFDLLPRKYGYGIGYDPTINPNVNNEFATAAFRFGHTLLQPIYPLYEPHADRPSQIIQLRNNFNNPAIYANPKTPDNLARGLTLQPMQTFDSSITQEVTTQLFRNEHPFGLDLISLNIQRGRDHGLPTYNDMREACGLGRAKTFQDLLAEVPEPSVLKFKSVYEHPDDIDLFIGGISETSVHDAVLGPTFLCIIGDQYTRLKRGDRFFYELNTGKNSFTEAQLDEIRRASIARLLCDNTDVGEMQPLAFVRPSPNFNNKQHCLSPAIPRVNLAPWKEAYSGFN